LTTTSQVAQWFITQNRHKYAEY